jgi:diaminohydroxyphosphoribosylaminopyrimidine deaminase/5-amino-6-(5-phosphoribosylamino)uracil reductase
MVNQDLFFMNEAIELAERSAGMASPNPPVGCVVACKNAVIGRGWHEYALRDHAEVCALRQAGADARGATAYVTLEPCSHYGRTPPCIHALLTAGIRRVVVAQPDPNPRVSGSGIRSLREAGIEVEVGLCQERASRLIEAFARHVTSGLPLVVGKAAMSLDGRIAACRSARTAISSQETLAFGQKLRWQLDAIVVGIGTILADNPQLTYRGSARKARPLAAVILDSRLRTPTDARLFDAAPGREILIFCGENASEERRKKLEDRGGAIVPVAGGSGGLDLHAILRQLGACEKLGILVEGGSEIHGSFFAEGLMDKFYFMISPIVLGGRDSVPAVGGPGFATEADAPRFRIAQTLASGPDHILEAYPRGSKSILSPWRS